MDISFVDGEMAEVVLVEGEVVLEVFVMVEFSFEVFLAVVDVSPLGINTDGFIVSVSV